MKIYTYFLVVLTQLLLVSCGAPSDSVQQGGVDLNIRAVRSNANDKKKPVLINLMVTPSIAGEVHSTVSISVLASDNVGVLGVKFFVDGVQLGSEDTSTSYAVLWDTTTKSNGSHTVHATARDAAGNVGTSSLLTVRVNNR